MNYSVKDSAKNDLKLPLLREAGYHIGKDSDQPGFWLWTFGSDGCDSSFESEDEAINGAWDHAIKHVLAYQELDASAWSSEEKDLAGQEYLFREAFGIEVVEAQTLDLSDALLNISDTLAQADGEYLATIYNQLCSDKIHYIGDGLFRKDAQESEVAVFRPRP